LGLKGLVAVVVVWNGNILEQKFPRLYSFAKKTRIYQWQAFSKTIKLSNNFMYIIQQTQISNEAKGIWKYLWGNALYTASKFYHLPYSLQKCAAPKALHMDLELQLFK
jgi:hypothetical protein